MIYTPNVKQTIGVHITILVFSFTIFCKICVQRIPARIILFITRPVKRFLYLVSGDINYAFYRNEGKYFSRKNQCL